MLWLLFGEGTVFLFTAVLSLRDIPINKQITMPTYFYVHNLDPLEPRRPTSLHEDIIGPQTVLAQIGTKEFSNSLNVDSLSVVKNTQYRVTKIPP